MIYKKLTLTFGSCKYCLELLMFSYEYIFIFLMNLNKKGDNDIN